MLAIKSLDSTAHRLISVAILGLGLTVAACGSDAEPAGAPGSAASIDAAASTSSKPAQSATVKAAKAAGTIDTKYFRTVLPEGWEVLADDLDGMGLMTLAEKGTGGSQGVYLKFEGGGNFSGDPKAAIEKFANKYKGTPAATVQRNGIDWARTSFTYNGIPQSLNITANQGYKVTLTVMGKDYDADPGVKAIFDDLSFK